jgi:hypothetical protein
MRVDWMEYYHVTDLLKLTLIFIVPFVIFRLLIYGWTNKVGGKPAGFSPIGASMMLASIFGTVYLCIIIGVSAPTESIITQVIRSVMGFPSIFLVLLSFCLMYFFFLFRGQAIPSGRVLSLMVVGCLIVEVLWIEYFFGP